MNPATVILLVYAVAITILLAVACENTGYWKLQAENAEAEIADDNVIIAWLKAQVSGHIRDHSLLLVRQKHEAKAAPVVSPALVPGEVAAAVDAWLAGNTVPE